MGFKPKRTKYKLNFSEVPDLAGLEVYVRGVSIGGLAEIAGMAEALDGLDPENLDLKELRDRLRTMFEPFAAVIISWNVEDDDDQPVPATVDGLLSQELPFIKDVIEAYVAEMASVAPPLPSASGSGPSSEEAALGLASVSSSLPSLPTPT